MRRLSRQNTMRREMLIKNCATSTVLGINRTQDASLCALRGAELLGAVQKERITRRKHHWGALGDFTGVYSNLDFLQVPIDLVVECFSSDPQSSQVEVLHSELKRALHFRGEPRII